MIITYFVDCGILPQLVNGVYTLTNSSNTFFDATASVECVTGHVSDISTITCLPSGIWETTVCEVKGKKIIQLIDIRIPLSDNYHLSVVMVELIT